MRYSRNVCAPAGEAQVLPWVILEFLGRVSWTISIHPCLRLDIRDLIGERIGVHRPIIDLHIPFLVEPGERVFHPGPVVAVREILARVSAAAFGAVLGGVE